MKRPRIDKSALAFGEPARVRDRAYLDTFAGQPCEACGATHGVVGAHVRTGHEGGTSLKPSDDLVVALCFRCHQDQEATPGPEWWLEHVFKRGLRARYRLWAARPQRAVDI